MRAGYRLAIVSAILVGVVIFLFPATANAQDIDCAECHDDVVFDSPAHPDVVCHDCHSNVTAEHDDAGDLEPLGDGGGCLSCHSRTQREIDAVLETFPPWQRAAAAPSPDGAGAPPASARLHAPGGSS